MMNNRIACLCVLLLAAAGTACAENTEPWNRGPVRPIDNACLPVGTSPREIALYREDIDVRHTQIAYVDSCSTTDCFPELKDKKEDKIPPQDMQRMLADLKRNARSTGADAVVRVKLLHRRVSGFKEHTRTPFRSWTQGEWREYFFRGIAIKFKDPADRERTDFPAIPVTELATPAEPATKKNDGTDKKQRFGAPSFMPGAR